MDVPGSQEEDVERRSVMRLTAENAGYAIIVGMIVTVLVALIVGCVRLAIDIEEKRNVDVLAYGVTLVKSIPVFFLCIGPVVFIPIFALLQRTRVR
jgi:ABC-type microcin C transport system permease subunit YejB